MLHIHSHNLWEEKRENGEKEWGRFIDFYFSLFIRKIIIKNFLHCHFVSVCVNEWMCTLRYILLLSLSISPGKLNLFFPFISFLFPLTPFLDFFFSQTIFYSFHIVFFFFFSGIYLQIELCTYILCGNIF